MDSLPAKTSHKLAELQNTIASMNTNTTTARFKFLSEAFEGTGGFAPRVIYGLDGSNAGKRVPTLTGATELVPYQRESVAKFAGRNAIAVYENHLRQACERFVSFLGRRNPQRAGTESPLVELLTDDADLRGSNLDSFWNHFALQAKARGSMLLLIDMPDAKEEDPGVQSLAEQIARRAVPVLRAVFPENVKAFELDDDTGLLISIAINTTERVTGADGATSCKPCVRRWDASGWQLLSDDRIIKEGAHPFRQCPVLAFTENGGLYPQVGKYAQIADISRAIFNRKSERDEILRGQTFCLLTLQVTPEQGNTFKPDETAATIGTHSMLVHQGIAPSFIAPDSGPADTYQAVIEQLENSIRRIAMDDSTTPSAQAESGLARRMRFEALNADIATFAVQMQNLERRMWGLFHRALGTTNRIEVTWPSDYNLIDTLTEIDILSAMQLAAFPAAVLAEKQRAIVAAEFDGAEEPVKAALLASIDETLQAPRPNPEAPGTPPGTPPEGL